MLSLPRLVDYAKMFQYITVEEAPAPFGVTFFVWMDWGHSTSPSLVGEHILMIVLQSSSNEKGQIHLMTFQHLAIGR
jgi:hypothetical protein